MAVKLKEIPPHLNHTPEVDAMKRGTRWQYHLKALLSDNEGDQMYAPVCFLLHYELQVEQLEEIKCVHKTRFKSVFSKQILLTSTLKCNY